MTRIGAVALIALISAVPLHAQSIVAGCVSVGGHEPTLTRLIAQFAPFMESAKSRDIASLAGIRF